MLVVVVIGDVDLANLLVAVAAVDLRNHADLETPVGGDSQIAEQAFPERKLSCKDVAVTVEIIQIRRLPNDTLQRANHRRHQQPTHPSIDFVLGHPRVVALAELITKERMGDRINQPRQQAAVVGQDVAVVECDRLCPPGGQCIAHAVPDVAPLTELLRREPRLLQPRVNRL